MRGDVQLLRGGDAAPRRLGGGADVDEECVRGGGAGESEDLCGGRGELVGGFKGEGGRGGGTSS